MALKEAPQAGLLDELLEDSELEKLLDNRSKASEKLAPFKLAFQGLDKQVRAKVAQILVDKPDGDYRCGRWVVKKSTTEDGKHVEFERSSSTQYRFKLAD